MFSLILFRQLHPQHRVMSWVKGFFALFPFGKSAESARSSIARVHGRSSSSELSAHQMARPAVQRPSTEGAYDVYYVECDGRWWGRHWDQADSGTAGSWPLRTGPGSARSCGGLRGLSVGCRGDGCGVDHAASVPCFWRCPRFSSITECRMFQLHAHGYGYGRRCSCEMQWQAPAVHFCYGILCRQWPSFTGAVLGFSFCATLGSTVDT